jgi:hypothetical protein
MVVINTNTARERFLERSCPKPGRIREANTARMELWVFLSVFAMNGFIISDRLFGQLYLE